MRGTNLEKTLAGFLMEKTDDLFRTVFAPNAHLKTDGSESLGDGDYKYETQQPLASSVHIGAWNALSKSYARGAGSDAHIYLLDGMTRSQSVFWNTELIELRQKQQNNEIKDIFLHTMKDGKLEQYKLMETALKTAKDSNLREYSAQESQLHKHNMPQQDRELILKGIKEAHKSEEGKLQDKMDGLLKNPDNWTATRFDASKFKIQVTTTNEPKAPEVSLSAVQGAASRWKKSVDSMKQYKSAMEDLRSRSGSPDSGLGSEDERSLGSPSPEPDSDDEGLDSPSPRI